MSGASSEPADVTPECVHVERGELPAFATVTVHVFGGSPSWTGVRVSRTVCPYCAGMAMGVWFGPIEPPDMARGG